MITPIVDDARAFGRIAAANALSDIYAMGGKPQVALSFVGFPEILGLPVLEEILQGMAEKAHEAGCAIVGGHTIKDTEPKCGLAVIGAVAREKAWTHCEAKAGEVLVLTKAIGTGLIAQSIKKGAADAEAVHLAVESMQRLNRDACLAGLEHGVSSATDVTGFGLLGHLRHMVEGSGVAAEIDVSAIPQIPGALAAAEAGFIPGGTKRNLDYVRPHLRGLDRIEPAKQWLLADAQTSGGLLMSVRPEQATALLSALDDAHIIGRLRAGDPGLIFLN